MTTAGMTSDGAANTSMPGLSLWAGLVFNADSRNKSNSGLISKPAGNGGLFHYINERMLLDEAANPAVRNPCKRTLSVALSTGIRTGYAVFRKPVPMQR
jgi:hypothetical protein